MNFSFKILLNKAKVQKLETGNFRAKGLLASSEHRRGRRRDKGQMREKSKGRSKLRAKEECFKCR